MCNRFTGFFYKEIGDGERIPFCYGVAYGVHSFPSIYACYLFPFNHIIALSRKLWYRNIRHVRLPEVSKREQEYFCEGKERAVVYAARLHESFNGTPTEFKDELRNLCGMEEMTMLESLDRVFIETTKIMARWERDRILNDLTQQRKVSTKGTDNGEK